MGLNNNYPLLIDMDWNRFDFALWLCYELQAGLYQKNWETVEVIVCVM